MTRSPFQATELIASWNATTPACTWLVVQGRVRGGAAGWSPWFTLARWSAGHPEGGGAVRRSSVTGQEFRQGRVVTDTFLAAAPFDRFQVRLTAHTQRHDRWPDVRLVAALASAPEPVAAPAGAVPPPSAAGPPVELAVPPLSQRRHAGTFVHWGGGGGSWCSPTATTMLLRYWGRSPDAVETGWVGHDDDPEVVHAVSSVFDDAYGGAGNWAFNVAYAAERGLRGYVTRLRGLAEAELFLRAGVPLVLSVRFTPQDLPGAGYSTAGHLLAVIGLTAAGDVVCNDPGSRGEPDADAVRIVFPRAPFERAWAAGSRGIAYVVHPPGWALPPPPAREPNWG
ncbi:C39 family peptidase [Intrasporangium sp.]|uniref:C39 family peptidase n=1 Tax=Intrasporangium sp. TaxID=1925024 RepID=UPI0032218A8F